MNEIEIGVHAMLSKSGSQPTDTSLAPQLADDLRQKYPVDADVAEDLAWRVLREVVMNNLTVRIPLMKSGIREERLPFVAAKHLLGFANYPEDIERDTGKTLKGLLESARKAVKGEPATHSLVRKLVAVHAGQYGTSDVQLNSKHPDTFKIAQLVAEAFSEAKPEVVERLVRTVRRDIVHAPGARLSRDADRARGRKARIRAAFTEAIAWAKMLGTIAAVLSGCVILVLALSSVILKDYWGPTLAAKDPLEALARSESLVDGYGPSLKDQLEAAPGGLLLNPATHWDPNPGLVPSFDRGASFVDVIGADRLFETGPGSYEIDVRVAATEVRKVDRYLNSLSDVRLWLGLAAAKSAPYPYVVWARVDSAETGPVWASTGLNVECDCTVTIDPDSVRLYSDALPKGVRLDGADIDTEGQLVGYDGKDGVMPVYHVMSVGGSVLIKATLVVEQRPY